jgi:hypothetical protein
MVTSGGGDSLVGDEPIVSIGGEIGDGNGERLLVGQSVDVAGHVGAPRIWGRFSIEGRWLIILGYERRGAKAEARASAAWGLVNWAIRARWAVSSKWSSVMSTINCSGECGLIRPSKVDGGASELFEILDGFCKFLSAFSKICFGAYACMHTTGRQNSSQQRYCSGCSF